MILHELNKKRIRKWVVPDLLKHILRDVGIVVLTVAELDFQRSVQPSYRDHVLVGDSVELDSRAVSIQSAIA